MTALKDTSKLLVAGEGDFFKGTALQLHMQQSTLAVHDHNAVKKKRVQNGSLCPCLSVGGNRQHVIPSCPAVTQDSHPTGYIIPPQWCGMVPRVHICIAVVDSHVELACPWCSHSSQQHCTCTCTMTDPMLNEPVLGAATPALNEPVLGAASQQHCTCTCTMTDPTFTPWPCTVLVLRSN